MKKTGFIVLIFSLLFCLPAEAQFGDLIKQGKKAVKKAKEKVENIGKKINGDIDFYYLGEHKGFYRSKQHMIVFDLCFDEGEYAGKNATFNIEEDGKVVRIDGKFSAELLDGGIVNCRNATPYLLTLAANGDVIMDDEVIGHIDDAGKVYLEGYPVGKAPGIDKHVATLIFFGLLHDKNTLAKVRPLFREEKQRLDEEKRKAANQKRTWTISIKGFNSGYVDSDGTVYNWSRIKVGQLPKGGEGNITDANGNILGSIRNHKIYNRSGNLLIEVGNSDFYGDFTIPGSSDKIVVDPSGNVILQKKDNMMVYKDAETLGNCNARPYSWVAAIVVCNIFKL